MFGRLGRSISAAWRELRASSYTLTDSAAVWSDFYANLNTASGVSVTAEKALRQSALFACGRILAESVAQLPCSLRKIGYKNSKKPAKSHELFPILHSRANPNLTAYKFRETMQFHASTQGNAYAEIVRDGTGRVAGLYPWQPDVVRLEVDGHRLKYFLRTAAGPEQEFQPEQVLHICGLSLNGLYGVNPITHLRETIGEGIAAQEFGARFFSQGAAPPFVLREGGKAAGVKPIGPEARNLLERSFREKYAGAINAGRVPILYEGMDAVTLGISNVDAQFLELRKFIIEEFARFFRIPLHLLQSLDRSTFNNIVQQSLEFVIYTLLPWLENWEQQVELQLLTDEERDNHEVVFNVSGFLRGDTQSRYKAYLDARTGGWLNTNEIRALEDMNNIGPDGDKYNDPLNTNRTDGAGDDEKPKTGAEDDEAASLTNRLVGAGDGNGNGDHHV